MGNRKFLSLMTRTQNRAFAKKTPGDSLKNNHDSNVLQRTDVIESPSEITEQIEKSEPSRKITKTLPKIDSFLIHDFNFKIMEEEENPHKEPSVNPFLLPMLIEIRNPNWNAKITDCKEFYRTEYVVGCYGSIESIIELSKDPDVISVESADVG
jgi:hypothetical protein